MKAKFVLAAAAALAWATPVTAQIITATNPNSIVQALQAGGYRAQLGRDSNGDPKIDTAAGGTNFIVYFFDCTNGRDCRAVQLHSSYEMDTVPALSRLNEWNRDHRYGRAFISGNNFPTMEMDINLDAGGGMSRALFLDNVELFTTLLPQFERMIGWGN
ncbi:MAG: YbjN domain-containing protein [Sphingomonas sp.]